MNSPKKVSRKVSVPVLATFSKGHFRLMKKMGLRIASDEIGGDTPEAIAHAIETKLSPEERDREGTAYLWLMTRPVDDVSPGGSARQAIDDGTWPDAVERWELTLSAPEIDALGEALKAAE